MVMTASEFNAQALGRLFTMADLPRDWLGAAILAAADEDEDHVLTGAEPLRVDWDSFSDEVRTFQEAFQLDVDGKLGKRTLFALQNWNDGAIPEELFRIGDVSFRRPVVYDAPPVVGLPSGDDVREIRISRLYNAYGGEIRRQAAALEVNPMAALAVFATEAGSRAYDGKTGLLIIRVETPGRWPKGEAAFRERYGRGQGAEWKALAEWAAADSRRAFERTSSGLGQILGSNAEMVGYSSPLVMMTAFQRDVRAQIAAHFQFVEMSGLVGAVAKGDWKTFARRYNGPGQVEHYASEIVRNLEAAERLFS